MYRWLHARSVPLHDTEGRVVRWFNLVADIEDRKKADERLRRSEASLLDAQRLTKVIQQVAMKPDESLSPSLFTFRSHLAAIHHHWHYAL